MKHLRTFRYGGLSLPQDLSWSIQSPIPNAFLPVTALILLKQHAGPAARCVVRKGDLVREGSMIGKADRPGMAHVHASVPGIVKDIRALRVAADGPIEAVELSLEGSFDRLGKRVERYVWARMSRVDMLQTLRDRGVVEMESPGRPIGEIISSHERCPLLVLNCVESEPFVRTEKAVLRARGEEVIEGFAILRKIVGPENAVAAFAPDGDEDAEAMSKLIDASDGDIETAFLESRYPQDMPNQLLSVLRVGKRSFGISESLVVRPSTCLAIYEALVLAKPLVERYVTIAGGAIKHPAVLKTRIGTSIGDLIEECGGFLGSPDKIVLGGPFRGLPVFSLDTPITKLTGAILALTREESNPSRMEACIRCGRCSEVCPERLSPSEIFRRLEKHRHEEAVSMGLGDCTYCGACGYICPSRIPLVDAFRCGEKRSGAGR